MAMMEDRVAGEKSTRERRDRGEFGTVKSCLTLLWINVAMSRIGSCALVGKCCPDGQAFSVEKNFACSPSGDRRLYHSRRRLDHADFPGCDESQNFTISSLGVGDWRLDSGIMESAAVCLDLIWDEKIARATPILLRCQRESEDDSDERRNHPSPSPTGIRVCCRRNTVFDASVRDCVDAPNSRYDNEDDFIFRRFKFLDNDKADFVSIVRGPPVCHHAIIDYAIDATRDVRLLDDGRLEVTLPERNGAPRRIIADENNSCIDPGSSGTEESLVARVCAGAGYCERETCVRKCCPEGEAMVHGVCDELPPGRQQTRPFHRLLLEASIGPFDSRDYGLVIGKPCKYGMFPVEPNETWRLMANGHFYLENYRIYDTNEYCMELLFENSRDPERLCPFVCFDESTRSSEESPLQYGIFAFLELTSCAFLIFTLSVYACLPVLRNLHGKTLMCHVASLIVAYATLAAVALATPSNAEAHAADASPGTTNFCKFLGFTLLLSWLAAFSWLNVMCFDIWWTFGGLGGGPGMSKHRSGAYEKRFVAYSLYAWGLSLSVTTCGVTADHTDLLPLNLRPNIGSDSCWFERNVYYYGEIIFFVGPVSLQIVANVVFFVLTAIYCSRVKAEIRRVMAAPNDPRSRRFRADRTKLIMNLKLFIVMGVSWSLEVVSSYLNHYATGLTWRNEFFYVSDLFNCLQGVVIFVLFVVKARVWEALGRRFGRVSGGPGTPVAPASQGGLGLRDPYRVKNSASSSTIVSAFGVNASSA